MISWRWPYTLDKLEPQQTLFWPRERSFSPSSATRSGSEALGRYLWKVDRPRDGEIAYWTSATGRTVRQRAGRPGQLLQWYDITGPILPGLQNLTHIRNMNCFPTAIGKEQMVDAMLDTAACTRDYPAGHRR